MKILTAAEMGAADRRTVQEFGTPLGDLMEAAGSAVAAFCLRQYPAASRVTVLCGKGNNGGDGLVAARVLAGAGKTVQIVLLGSGSELKGEAAAAWGRLQAEGGETSILKVEDEVTLAKALDESELVIDAVVGTGFKPPLRGLALTARDLLKESNVPVVAVDLPSGWDADSMSQTVEGAFRADALVTFTAPKLAHVFGHLTASTFGSVVVAGIGSPDAAVKSETRLTWTGSAKAVAEKPRGMNSNKGKFGHVLLVGGAWGKAGAPAMASLAALRAGAGLVTAGVIESIVGMVAGVAPELMISALVEAQGLLRNLEGDRLQRLMKGITVLAVGPGLGTDGDASEFARELVAKTEVPVVIDADGLNAFVGKTDLLKGTGRTMVLTPHPGEMARLAGMTVKEVEADRVGLARRFATDHELTLVLKGWRTLVAHPDGSVAVNTTGNPSMAKGGSGDILTGIVAAMLAQFPNDVARAVEAAVYMHGLAGDFAAHAMDEHTVLATDTVKHLSDAFRYRVKDADGLAWICGLNAQKFRGHGT
ncbi:MULTISPECIES: NAD(P)H-hydrate dehydratase [Acidobacteriaceae]|uniref:NAD(P)H-hydrate dehydratase n=1 Tax=Acidobacteriaceae TaxID=204434 RepID=UPI00131D1324|nr:MULTISPECIES: NAD(P)H-hydrate dehydratase [Acidobacteriaceae]MDW5264158.1 NAD(P)H-hydrate dehydratase [Edaphobacter sp.]